MLPRALLCLVAMHAADLSAQSESYAASQRALYREAVKHAPGNAVLSPYALQVATGMLYAGARGKTAEQLAKALALHHDPQTQGDAHAALQAAWMVPAAAADNGDNGVTIKLASRLWVDAPVKVSPAYQALVNKQYLADAASLDLASHPEQARRTINAWTAEQTSQLVPDLLAEGSIDTNTWLLQTAALSFAGAWSKPFTVLPEKVAFRGIRGTHAVTMMRNSDTTMPYQQDPAWEAVQIPYKGGKFAMLLVVPKNDFFAVESTIDLRKLASDSNAWEPQGMVVTWPKFHIETETDAKSVLQALGVHDLFIKADLGGIASSAQSVGAFLEKAVIMVDEHGTQAAAATASQIAFFSGHLLPSRKLLINRPFLFYIRETKHDTVLFSGRVVD